MLSFESFLETFQTGSGFWNPLVWLVVILVAFLIVLIVRGFGRKDFKDKTGLSGAEAIEYLLNELQKLKDKV